MNKQTSQRIASLSLVIFGLFELMGLMMLIIPTEYIPADFEPQTVFWALISGLYGVSRIIAGFAIWSNKKWGMVLGFMLCLTTMIVAPTIIPFGVIDLIFTMIITISLLYAYFGNEQMTK
jgi:hypothetical protein